LRRDIVDRNGILISRNVRSYHAAINPRLWKNKDNLLRRKHLNRGLFVSSGYLLATCLLKLMAVNQFEKALAQQNIIYQELIVKPTAFNTILWNANIATTEGYFLGDYSFFDTQPIAFTFYPKNVALEEKVAHLEDFKKLQHISEGWYLITEENHNLYFNDLRFGLLNDSPKQPQFAFSYVFISDNDGTVNAQEVPKTKRDGKVLLQNIFTRIIGN